MAAKFAWDSTAKEVAEAFKSSVAGKRVLVTGVTKGGTGAEAAKALAAYGAEVILAGRSPAKIKETIDYITAETPSAKLKTLLLDQSSLESVRKAAAEANAIPGPLHILINSAATSLNEWTKTTDGFETQLQTNYLSPFLFTSLLYPKIAASGTGEFPARIVNLASRRHAKSDFLFDDYNFDKDHSDISNRGYGASKTAIIRWTHELAKRLKEVKAPVLTASLHPGFIISSIAATVKEADWLALGAVKDETGQWSFPGNPYMRRKTPEQGASTYLFAALDPSIADMSGYYLMDCKDAEEALAPFAKASDADAKLWSFTEELVKQPFKVTAAEHSL